MHCKRVTLCVKILTMEYDETLMKIAVCDDEQKDCDDLFLLIQNYLQNNGFNFEIHMFSTGDKLLKTLADNHFSLLFLDIYLSSEEATGMEIARLIRRMGLDLPIIFTTNSCDFAVESYEVDALYYLVKPVTFEKIQTVMKKCRKLLEDSLQYIDVVSGRKNTRIYAKSLIYAEAFGNSIVLHTTEGDIRTYLALDRVLQDMGMPFLRCHKSYIVNMNYIRRIDGKDFLLTNGIRIPIRTNGRAEVVQRYNRFLVTAMRESCL